MNFVQLTREQQRAVCEDLLLIEQAGRMQEVWSLRRMWLRDRRSASPWVQVEANRLARAASSICGGSPDQWRDSAVAALGFPSRAAAGIEAVCEVAEDVRWQESQQAAPRSRLTIGSMKRGGR